MIMDIGRQEHSQGPPKHATRPTAKKQHRQFALDDEAIEHQSTTLNEHLGRPSVPDSSAPAPQSSQAGEGEGWTDRSFTFQVF